MQLPKREFAAMTAAEIAAADTSAWIAVLPLGATEQHGPHLPAETDAIIAEAIARRLAEVVAATVPLTVLATEAIGYSPEHLGYPATRSLSWDEAIARWIGIGESLAAQGIRKLLLLNAHGGNSALMTIVATELRRRAAMLCVATSWQRHLNDGAVDPRERQFGIHGGEIETSVILALRPNLVASDRIASFPSRQEQYRRDFRHLSAYGASAFGWKIEDLNPAGAIGDATKASAAKGESLLAMSVESLVELVGDIDRFDLSQFDRADGQIPAMSR